MTAAALLRAASERLAAAGIETARLDAEVLLAHALGIGRAALYARLREPADGAGFEALLARRLRREPIAYIVGEQELWSLPFLVTPDVLIPRPETELLIATGLRWIAALPRGRAPATALDLGTGSGCIAVALAHELPALVLAAVDLSPAALAVARRNAQRHGVAERIRFLAGDLYEPLSAGATFDLIVSNPPYLAPGDAASPETACEPPTALFAGADGLDVIRRVVAGAPSRLAPAGALLVEIGAGQAAAAQALAAAAGLAARVAPDLAGIPRLLVAQHPGSAGEPAPEMGRGG
ncbi:peptide chain release factor N(5)-glutamine methyltransferase [bacterium]|nr:peptide chain release factor N(5)-glutamine methyltransferase [bacterium]